MQLPNVLILLAASYRPVLRVVEFISVNCPMLMADRCKTAPLLLRGSTFMNFN